MPRTAIDICNRALSRIGAEDIASLDDESEGARSCAREYEDTLRAALTAPGGRPFRWAFATTQAALTRLSATPVARHAYAWQIPLDCLQLHAILVNDTPIEFARLDDKVFCDYDDGVVAEYTFQADPDALPAAFVEALVAELAGKLATSLLDNEGLAERLGAEAERRWAGARSADSQAHTSRRIRANRLTTGRFGGPSWRVG
jgi:hypothetical protein